mmetsp:Transcript_9423/g.26246  ORF Transcript_9423/g.26246 Transcript_9423/m.26246 type:complete len:225 (-) Transcript_9423:703-1377(-)
MGSRATRRTYSVGWHVPVHGARGFGSEDTAHMGRGCVECWSYACGASLGRMLAPRAPGDRVERNQRERSVKGPLREASGDDFAEVPSSTRYHAEQRIFPVLGVTEGNAHARSVGPPCHVCNSPARVASVTWSFVLCPAAFHTTVTKESACDFLRTFADSDPRGGGCEHPDCQSYGFLHPLHALFFTTRTAVAVTRRVAREQLTDAPAKLRAGDAAARLRQQGNA